MYPVVPARGLAAPPANFRGAFGTVLPRALFPMKGFIVNRGCVTPQSKTPFYAAEKPAVALGQVIFGSRRLRM